MQLFKVCSMFVMMMALSQMDSMVSATGVEGTKNKLQPPPGQSLPNIYRRAGDDVSAVDCQNRREELNDQQLAQCKVIDQQQGSDGTPVAEVGQKLENDEAPVQNKRSPPPSPTPAPPANGGAGTKPSGPVKKRAIDHFYKRSGKQGKSPEHGKDGSAGPGVPGGAGAPGAPSGPGAQKRSGKQDPSVDAQKEDAPGTGVPGKGTKGKPSTPDANPQKREKPEAGKSGKKEPKPNSEAGAGKKTPDAAED
ncbi:hypothetical protein BJ944DRAFT_241687 [Cunninghamella echinulata]|nr:hypothetical protein BJ944DRAFT_241687 [Cunninghamella echinulata]